MGPTRKPSNGRSPLVNPQRQITSFFSKATSPSPSPSPSPLPASTLFKGENPGFNPNPKPPSPSNSPSPSTPSPLESKITKPLLVIGQTPSPSTSPALSTPAATTQSYGKEVVEKRIRVYWPLDKSWYEGCVKAYNEDSGKHLVQYDDFEEELLDLGKEKIEWIEETVKKFKRLRRGSLAFNKTAIEDEEMKDVDDIKEDNDGDDSNDEDWGKNPEMDVSDEGDMDLEDEEEEDNVKVDKKKKRGGKSESRKRKACVAGKLGCGKKGDGAGDVSKEGLKVSIVEPVNNKGSEFSPFFLSP